MFYFLFQCIRNFGLFHGLHVYINIKILKTGHVTLNRPKQQIFFRADSIDVHTFREIFLREEYNLNLPSNFPVVTIIDAGANIGFTSLFFLHKFPDAKIISLEPDTENFALLQKNVATHANIIPVQRALWKNSGYIKVIDNGYGIRGFMIEDTKDDTHEGVFEATTLTDLINKNSIAYIDILKMDIEGSEKEVFQADTTWLSITRCLVIELHDRMKPGCSKSVFKALANYNFECSIKGENLVFINRDLL